MKKVLLLLAAAALMASPAMGNISGSKHDLSSTNATNPFRGSSDELCVYCHTPHGGLLGGFAPLWNRTNGGNPTGFYNSSTLDATVNNAGILTSDALLCLSCHDGSSLTGALLNPPNVGGVQTQPTFGGGNITGQGNLTLDMTNDHPVGFVYSTSSADTEIVAAPAGLNVSYGIGSNEMWCSSCHDVHNNQFPPFLAADNAGSALCLTCHIK